MERMLPGLAGSIAAVDPLPSNSPTPGLDELMTVEDVAALLKVSKSWVYEHTRSRGVPRSERLPCLKLGKYVRFEPAAVRAFITKRSKFA